MSGTVAEMTKSELRAMIADVVEAKLREVVSDPDAGLALRVALRARLVRQKRAVARGERGEPVEDVTRRLRLA